MMMRSRSDFGRRRPHSAYGAFRHSSPIFIFTRDIRHFFLHEYAASRRGRTALAMTLTLLPILGASSSWACLYYGLGPSIAGDDQLRGRPPAISGGEFSRDFRAPLHARDE